jgi:3-oxoacyl-[acyl-carrier protein] reductase
VRTLDGKGVVVTGGSRGIGAAIVHRLAAEGARVVFGYKSNTQAARAVLEQVREAGGNAWAVCADLADPEQVKGLFAAVDNHVDRLDVLVNNAGVPARVTVEDVSVAEFDRVFAINTRAPLLAMQQASARMRAGGRIINISSVSTRWPAADEILYAATKGALEQLTRVAARALGPRQIRVNTVSPGTTETEFLRANVEPDIRDAVAAMTPLGRLGRPSDIAAVVAYLAGPGSGWLTGQNLRADGGLV